MDILTLIQCSINSFNEGDYLCSLKCALQAAAAIVEHFHPDHPPSFQTFAVAQGEVDEQQLVARLEELRSGASSAPAAGDGPAAAPGTAALAPWMLEALSVLVQLALKLLSRR